MVRLSPSPSLIALAAAVAVLAAAPALASSSASSASSEGSSASSGSVSDSFESSSDSSKTDEKDKVAAGDYRLVRVAAAATQPGKLALTLRQDAADGAEAREFVLLVPEATVQTAALATGDTVTAKSRSFGWEFAAGATQQPFYLVLHDTQRREFSNQKVQA